MHDASTPTRDETPFLTEMELAKRWNVTTSTLRNWRSRDTGPSFTKIGRLVRYPVTAVLEFERAGGAAGRRAQR